MKLIRHGVASFVLMGMVIALFVSAYTDISSYYNVVSNDDQYSEITGQTGNIMQQLDSLQLMQGMNSISSNILSIGNPDASFFDIVGGLVAIGIGALRVVFGLVVFPLDIGFILLIYYTPIPPVLIAGIGILFSVYLAFIIVSKYVGGDV